MRMAEALLIAVLIRKQVDKNQSGMLVFDVHLVCHSTSVLAAPVEQLLSTRQESTSRKDCYRTGSGNPNRTLSISALPM